MSEFEAAFSNAASGQKQTSCTAKRTLGLIKFRTNKCSPPNLCKKPRRPVNSNVLFGLKEKSMYVDLLRNVEEIKKERFSEPRITARGLFLDAPRKAAGLYFIYTSYSIDELAGAVAANNGGAVPISRLVAAHRRMPAICQITRDGFRLVYNGIAGFNGGDYGLRTRIGQHFTSKDRPLSARPSSELRSCSGKRVKRMRCCYSTRQIAFYASAVMQRTAGR